LHQNLKTVLKKKGDSKLSTISALSKESLVLFDIATCHCSDFTKCNCPRESKVPVLERQFLLDQRNEQKMVIGGLDTAATSRLMKKTDRAQKRDVYYRSLSENKALASSSKMEEECGSEMELSVQESDDSCHLSSDTDSNASNKCSQRNMMKIPRVAHECDRYGVSNAAGAAIATAALTDYGIIDENDSTAVIDHSKLRHQRQQLRTTLMKDAKSTMLASGPVSLFFDGRKERHVACLRLIQRVSLPRNMLL